MNVCPRCGINLTSHSEAKPELQVGDEIVLQDTRPSTCTVIARQPGGRFLVNGNNGRIYKLTKQRIFKSLAQVKRGGEVIWTIK